MRHHRFPSSLTPHDNGIPNQPAAARDARCSVRNRPGRREADSAIAAFALLLRWGRRASLLIVCWGLGGALSAFGQGTAPVTGTVRDPNGTPVEFATITLHRVTDSTVVKSEFSDAKGAFALGAPAGGRYRVSVAQVGYERYWSPPFELPITGLGLPAVALRTSAATMLQEVQVIGQKPLFEHQADPPSSTWRTPRWQRATRRWTCSRGLPA